MFKNFLLTLFLSIIFLSSSFAEKVDKVVIFGNERISKDTIIIFGEIDIKEDFTDDKLNKILKNLYDTNFFEDIKISVSNKVLNITLVEIQ